MRPVPREQRVCLSCGETFSFRNAPSRNGRGKYCSKSCGNRATSTKHGHTTKTSQSPTYGSWCAMVGRCTNPTNPKFYLYGARGITVCERWRSFEDFLADMGERPEGMTLDRIDTNGNYEPGNCRWATPLEQQHNLRVNRNVTFNGKTQCVTAWERELGFPRGRIAERLARGHSVEAAFSAAPLPRGKYGLLEGGAR